MINIVRVWMDNQSNFIISDDQEYVAKKISEWISRGGRVLDHNVINEPDMGLVFARRREEDPAGTDPAPAK